MVFCCLFGKPEAFLNVVLFIPNLWAVLVINTAKSASVGAKCSAKTVAQSLADLTITAIIASFTVMVSPARTPSLDGERPAAVRETFSLSVSLIWLFSKALKVMYKVISLVKEAG